MSFTLLLTCVGGELAPEMIRGLKTSRRHDVTVIGVDSRSDAAGRHFADVFAQVPRGDDAGYIEAIAEQVSQHGADLVLPTSDEEALVLAASRERIEGLGCQLACADVETLQTVSDKARCYARLAELGLPVPQRQVANDMDQLAAAVDAFEAIGRDFVVKPAVARGGRGIRVVSNRLSGAHPYEGGREIHMDAKTFRDTYIAEFVGMLPALVMERLVEPVHDLDMLAWQGRPVRVVPRRRVDSALPNEGHTVVDDPALIALGEALIEGLNLSWLYDCDLMFDADGNPGILEINPRPSGSIAATIAAGVPLLDDLISLAKGEEVADVDIPFGTVVIPYKTFEVLPA